MSAAVIYTSFQQTPPQCAPTRHAPIPFGSNNPTPGQPDARVLDNLRSRIRAIERGASATSLKDSLMDHGAVPPAISLGAPEIDRALPWNGLPTAGLHEVFGDAAALGFSAALLARLAEIRLNSGRGAPILWCQQGRDLYGQGLAEYGIDPDQVILVHGKNDTDILWAMEEGLRSPGLAAVIGKLHKVPPIAGRRLQLAAEENGTAGLLLRSTGYAGPQAPTGAALTRWRVTSAPSITPAHGLGLGAPKWNLELQRCRLSAASAKQLESAGKPKLWQVEWCDETGDLSVVTDLRNGSVEPQTDWHEPDWPKNNGPTQETLWQHAG